MASIKVNGQTFTGSHISVYGNKVIVDGIDRTPETAKIYIHVDGNIDSLSVESCSKVDINGSARNVTTVSGDVEIKGDVHGSVETVSGDVKAGTISGNVRTVSGDIN